MRHAREAVAADQALVASESAPDEMKLSELVQSEVTLGNAWASAAAQNKNAAHQADADRQGAQVSFEAALRTMGKMKRPDSAKRSEISRELARARAAKAAPVEPSDGLAISLARRHP